jgi:hypothetical protein
MTTREEENAERARVLKQDKAARDGATLADFATAEANVDRGRYSHISKPTIVKGTPGDYPAAPQWSKDMALLEPEPPLGLKIDGGAND